MHMMIAILYITVNRNGRANSWPNTLSDSSIENAAYYRNSFAETMLTGSDLSLQVLALSISFSSLHHCNLLGLCLLNCCNSTHTATALVEC